MDDPLFSTMIPSAYTARDRRSEFRAALHHVEGKTEVTVYTDGACPGNGRSDARGGIGVYFDEGSRFSFSAYLPPNYGGQPVTNNRAELAAILVALHITSECLCSNHSRLRVYTDSKYAYDALTKGIDKWMDPALPICTDWKTDMNTSVANQDLLKTIMGKEVEFKLGCCEVHRKDRSVVYRHTSRGNEGIERADVLAKNAAAGRTLRGS